MMKSIVKKSVGVKWQKLKVKQNAVFMCHKSSTAERTLDHSIGDVDYEHALPFSAIPGPRRLPWFGSWLDYKIAPSKIHRRDLLIKHFKEKYGGIVKETFAGHTVVHLLHPELIKQVYTTEGKYPYILPLLFTVQLYRKDRELSPGLGFSNGEDWYRLRTIVQKIMMRPQSALDFLPSQNEVGDDFVNKIDTLIAERGEIPNFNHWVSRWGLESSAKTCFDFRMGFLEETGRAVANEMITRNSDVFDLSTKLWFSLPFYTFLPTPGIKRLFDCEDYINSEGRRLLTLACAQYRKALEDGTLTEDSFRFLSYMLSSENISDSDVHAVVTSVFTDTLSTTVQALLFNLYTLACNPEAQEKAYEETKTVLDSSGNLSVEGFNSCSYLKACLKETFRFYPVGLDVQRLCPYDMVIGGYQVPKGTFILLESYVSLHDPEYVVDPEDFIPERWLRDEEEKGKIHPYLLLPFSTGTRMCAGRRFAEQDLIIVLSKILSRYRLEWHYGKLHQRFRLLQIPDQEVKIRFIPR